MSEKELKNLCDKIEDALLDATLQHHGFEGGDDSGFPLVDFLTPECDNDISRGEEEINLIVDKIYFALKEEPI